ncbi:hypothetical protein [Nocardia brasiliensis]|uniref:hypothetical protein n=1 Tax=Nocardia brasiliensis TaxID=37326 RepID=UPI002453FB20|nr:hypothetical protein [Nocardia brasiliensis]
MEGLSREYAREWRQFARWATATDRSVLPADAATVLAYLRAHPAGPATDRTRVSALNAAHVRTGHPLPGHAESLRRMLNPGRGERLDAARARAETILARLPVTGWTEGLHGRRDAVILLLATSGLSWAQIAGLTQRDLTLTDTAVTIGAQPLIELPATGDETCCPVRVFRRWCALLVHAPAAAGHLETERILTTGDDGPDAALRRGHARLPLLTEFDARGMAAGYIGELAPLTSGQVAAIATEHLLSVITVPSAELDPTSYERGIAARWRAREIFAELDDLLDRIEAITP